MVSPRFPVRPSTLMRCWRKVAKAEGSKMRSCVGWVALIVNCHIFVKRLSIELLRLEVVYLLRDLLPLLWGATKATTTASWSLLFKHSLSNCSQAYCSRPTKPFKASAGSKARYVLFLEAFLQLIDVRKEVNILRVESRKLRCWRNFDSA